MTFLPSVTLTLPLPPNLTNRNSGRSHWRTIHREKATYLAQLDERQACGLIPPPPKAPWSKIRIAATLVLGNPMDDDNALARCKWPLDWLVSRGYLVDDRRKHVTWTGLPGQIISRKEPPSVTLTVSPMADPPLCSPLEP